MQTFLPYPDFAASAKCLDRQRLGKQRVECLQILTALRCGPYQCAKRPIFMHSRPVWKSCPEDEYKLDLSTTLYRRTPWYNHPASKMWRGFECALIAYQYKVCNEWSRRGHTDTCLLKANNIHGFCDGPVVYPPWLGREDIHASHRSNLLRKKQQHYKQFGWTEPADLPYVWPL